MSFRTWERFYCREIWMSMISCWVRTFKSSTHVGPCLTAPIHYPMFWPCSSRMAARLWWMMRRTKLGIGSIGSIRRNRGWRGFPRSVMGRMLAAATTLMVILICMPRRLCRTHPLRLIFRSLKDQAGILVFSMLKPVSNSLLDRLLPARKSLGLARALITILIGCRS